MISLDTCPICNSNSLQKNVRAVYSLPLIEFVVEGINLLGGAVVNYHACNSCGAYIQSPRLSDDDIEKYYSRGFYRTWLQSSPERLDADEQARAFTDSKIIKDFFNESPASHLDIGASKGYLLLMTGADKQVAIEPNESYRSDVSMIKWHTSPDTVIDKFDLVSMVHVLEHVTNPLQYLENVAIPRLTDDGYLLIEVPSNQSPGGWERLAHLFHFQTFTLYYMAERLGMEIVKLEYTPHLLTIWRKK